MNKRWYIHKMEHGSTFKSKEILTHAIMWMNPADIILSEISQAQENKCCIIPFT